MMWSLTRAIDCRKVSKGKRNDWRKGRREEEGLWFVGREIRDGYDCGRERREVLMTMGGEVRGNDRRKGNSRMTVVWEGGRGE
jgi:hypothetical protein